MVPVMVMSVPIVIGAAVKGGGVWVERYVERLCGGVRSEV